MNLGLWITEKNSDTLFWSWSWSLLDVTGNKTGPGGSLEHREVGHWPGVSSVLGFSLMPRRKIILAWPDLFWKHVNFFLVCSCFVRSCQCKLFVLISGNLLWIVPSYDSRLGWLLLLKIYRGAYVSKYPLMSLHFCGNLDRLLSTYRHFFGKTW